MNVLKSNQNQLDTKGGFSFSLFVFPNDYILDTAVASVFFVNHLIISDGDSTFARDTHHGTLIQSQPAVR